jgi:hypothetical protein
MRNRGLIVVLLLALVAAGAMAGGLKFSGSTAATVYHDLDAVGVLDSDQNLNVAYGPLALALNAGYTYDFAALSHLISFGYTLSASQALGPFTFAGSIASSGLQVPVGGELAGEILGDINASIAFAKDAFSAKVLALGSGLKAGPLFKGMDISATYAPKFGSFTIGGSFLDAAQADALGAAVAAVEGLSVYAKATVNY